MLGRARQMCTRMQLWRRKAVLALLASLQHQGTTKCCGWCRVECIVQVYTKHKHQSSHMTVRLRSLLCCLRSGEEGPAGRHAL
eukprot:1160761-Pelagomonas_calceolata.AAC.8